MASFTDIIPQFNPYVQQLPVEAMVQVGMEKQKRYDEGIQKIQTQIDNIAGLDIAQDAQRVYLQSKLNELGNNLKNVAAGDFSNFQLVNSVGGMTGQLVKDPRIVNALSSTKAYRKGLEDMTTLTKEGKASASRTWEFKNAANAWLNGDVDSSFNTLYKPYTNYRKNATEIIKGLTGDSTIRDDAFDVDAKGNLVIKDAMTRTKLAGISPEKIQQALLTGLSPDDWEQISVDGRYNYANTTPQSFAESLNASYKGKYDAFAQQRTILENAKSSTSSAVEKQKIDQKIGELTKILNSVQEEYNSVSRTFDDGDAESAKARLFTANFMNGFSKAFSYTETAQTYETSPFAQAQQWRENKAQEWKKFTMEYSQRERFHKDTMSREDEKIRLEKLAQTGYSGFPAPVDPKDVPNVALDKVVATIDATLKDLNTQDDAFMKSQGKDKGWLDQQKIAWMKSPNGVDPLVAQHFNQTEGIRKSVLEDQIMVGQISAEADRKYGDVYKNIPKNAPNLTYTAADGSKTTYTPRDFVDFNSKINNYRTVSTTSGSPTTMTGGTTTVAYNDEKAKAELSPKDYKLYQLHKERYYRGESNLNRADQVLAQNLENYRKTVNLPYQQTLKEKEEEIGKEVKRRVMGYQGGEYNIPTTSKIQQESLASTFASVANLAEQQKGAIANSPDLNVAVLKKIAESGNPQGTIKVVEGTRYAPAMYEVTARGTAGSTTFRLTAEQKNAIFGDRFEASPAVQAFRPYQERMMKFSQIDPQTGQTSPYMSTSPEGGPTNVSNAALGPTDFFNVKSFGVSGNIVTGDGGRTYSLRLNVYDPITKSLQEDIPYPRLLLEGEVINTMQGLTDASLYQLIRDKVPTNTDLQKLQKASKNPL
jgi:ribosomal protein L17